MIIARGGALIRRGVVPGGGRAPLIREPDWRIELPTRKAKNMSARALGSRRALVTGQW